MSDKHGYPQLTPAQHLDFAIKVRRAEFLAQPPKLRAETRERVERLLEAERQRNQNQPSYLMQHHREIYEQ